MTPHLTGVPDASRDTAADSFSSKRRWKALKRWASRVYALETAGARMVVGALLPRGILNE